MRDIGLTDRGTERVNKPEQINIISPTLLARRTDGRRDKLPASQRGGQLVGAVAVSLAAHMALVAAAAAATPAFVQIVQRRRRIDIPFSDQDRPKRREDRRPTACVVFGRLLLERGNEGSNELIERF